MYMFVVIILLFLVSAYLALLNKFSYWEKQKVPHPPFSKIFGNLTEVIFLKKSLGQVYDEIYNKYPNCLYVGFYKMRDPAILIKDPELIKEVLVKNFHCFNENDVHINEVDDYLMIKNPFFCSGDAWKTARGQLTPSLTNNKVKSTYPLIETSCGNFVEYLNNPLIANAGTEVKEMCQKFTMDVVARCVLGLEANSFTALNTDYITNIKKIISPGIIMSIKLTILFVFPFIANFFKIKFLSDSVGNYFKNVIRETIEYREKNNIVRNDFLHSMQELQIKLGQDKFTNNDITAHTISFMNDGVETSSIILSYFLYELGANINYQENLRNEIENALCESNGKLTFDAIHEMTFLDKCYNETMRLHPAAMFMAKRCTQQYRLPPLDENTEGILLKPGAAVIVPVYGLHHDAKYFSNPNKFDPEHFSKEDAFTKYVFMPFGEGPRMCIGQRFATAQIKAAVVHLVLNYDIRVNSKTITPLEIDPTYFLMAAKGGIWLNFIKRKTKSITKSL